MTELLERAVAAVRALPADQQDAIASHILDEVRQLEVPTGKWWRVAERLARLDLPKGQSGEFVRHVREFRDGFGSRDLSGA